MKCRVCNSEDHRVLETVESGEAIRRRRKCERCGHRWTTFERDESGQDSIDRAALLDGLRQLQALVGGQG